MKIYFALLFLFCSFSAVAQQPYAPDPEPREHPRTIDVEHTLLNVRFNPEKGLVMGDLTHTFKPLVDKEDSFFLNAPGIRFKTVQLNGKNVDYTLDSDGITIHPKKKLRVKEEYNLRLIYEAAPRKGIYFIGWNDSTGRSRKQIWTQGESEDNRYWIPSDDNYNDKITTEIKITFPKGYKVLSNGELADSTINNNGTITWRYVMKKPHSPYLVMIGIGNYGVQKTESGTGHPLYYWYYPDEPDAVYPTFHYTPQIMDFYEKEIGLPFQWVKYAQIPVQDFIYGAMENTTATVFGDFYYVNKRQAIDRNYTMVDAHEMAHQWFGDLVTAKTYHDEWLQEGFATYYAKLAERHLFGDNFYQWNCKQEENTALAASKKNLLPITNLKAGSARIYQKASFVLGMLSDTVGVDNYNKVIKDYLIKYSYGNATTQDLADMFKQILGMDMGWFFDEWIFRGGEPHYKVSYESVAQKSQDVTRVHINQTQKLDSYTHYFGMPIRVDVHYKDGSMDWKKQWVDASSATIDIPNASDKAIDYVVFDPGNHILKSVEFNKSIEELKAQASKAPEMIDRYDAVEAMKNFGYYQKRDFLYHLYLSHPYYPIRQEIIAQMANDTDSLSRVLMLDAAKDSDMHVRLEAIQDIETISDSLRPAFEKLLTDSSYTVMITALNKLSARFPARIPQYLQMTDHVDGMSKNVRITWLQIAYANGSKNAEKELVDYLSPSFEFRTRINAMKALENLDVWTKESATYLLQAASSWNPRLAAPAQEVMKTMIAAHKKNLLNQAYNSGSWSLAEKAILQPLLKD